MLVQLYDASDRSFISRSMNRNEIEWLNYIIEIVKQIIVRSTVFQDVVWCATLKTKAVEASGTLVSAYHSTLNHNSEIGRVRERIFGYHFVFKVFVISEQFFILFCTRILSNIHYLVTCQVVEIKMRYIDLSKGSTKEASEKMGDDVGY